MCDFARRPNFDAGFARRAPEGDNDQDESATAQVHREVAMKESLARAQEGGRWIPPGGLPPMYS